MEYTEPTLVEETEQEDTEPALVEATVLGNTDPASVEEEALGEDGIELLTGGEDVLCLSVM